MGLKEYKTKRNFKKTPEPAGKKMDGRGEHRFVVQKHDASHLHYDFRLELEGVLKSWAVPKGPSMDPAVKRLAMMVEDHPIEYGSFEGIIPEGNYGAGTVMIWDEGTYHAIDTEGREANEKVLKEMLHKGSIKFVLEGKKLKGEFALVKTRSPNGKDNQWLLIKHRDRYANEEDITKKDKSVVTKRSLERIARESGEGNTVWHSGGHKNEEVDLHDAVKSEMPHHLKPMYATLVDEAFSDNDWIYEIKWDGYRAIAEINYNEVELYSRNNLSFNNHFDTIRKALQKLGIQAVLDGEIVALDEHGVARFELIQNYKGTGKGNIIYYVFDILYYNGNDLRDLPLLKRKEILKKVLQEMPAIRYNDHVVQDGIRFFREAVKQEIEGIIAKRNESVYQSGLRSRDWLKIKVHKRQEAIIAGFTEPRGGRKHLGSLVLGVYDGNELVYIGHSGGGFNEKSLEAMYKKLKPLVIKKSPFSIIPKTNMPVKWVIPQIVCEVKFQEWTAEGIMRMPIFLGIREDKEAKEVKREVEKEVITVIKDEKTKNKISESNIKSKNSKSNSRGKIRQPVKRGAREGLKSKKEKSKKNFQDKESSDEGREISSENKNEKEKVLKIEGKILKLTNLDKIYWPEEGYTKGDLINYYDKIAPYILPYLFARPESLRRSPNGISGTAFFQKDMPKTIPEWIQTKKIYSESNEGDVNYMICQDKASLIYMANLGCIEINPWNSRLTNLDYPDYIVIDLDPLDVPFEEVVEVAQAVKEILDIGKISGYCKTSGSRGLHIYIPMGARYDYDQGKEFAHLIASMTHELVPSITSLERSPAKRKNKIYLDYLQNRKGQTLAAPYCLRPKPGATVSTPLEWKEIKEGLQPSQFNIHTIFKRIEKIGDIFQAVLLEGIDLENCLINLKK
jgi:bifunctional non-homologous end joining protein LigD